MNELLAKTVPPRSTPICLVAALAFLEHGWSPIALCPGDHADVDAAHQRLCTTPGETPLWAWKEYQQRLPREAELRVFWNRNPRANVGIMLGPVSGLAALVLDGSDSEEWRRRLAADTLPDTLEIVVPGGGRRLLYALPADMTMSCSSVAVPGRADPIPCLAAGAHLALPPSPHWSGRPYTWRLGHGPDERGVSPAPPWLLAYLCGEDITVRTRAADQPWIVQPEGQPLPAPVPEHSHESALATEMSRISLPPHAHDGDPVQPHIVVLSDVKAAPSRWLWPGWMPLGKLVVLDGDPGLGKSTLLLDLAARVTRGLPLPDGAAGVRGGVTLLTAEDSLGDTVRPRLEAAGADLSRVRAFSSVGESDGGNRPPVIPRDLDVLRRILAESQSRLLIVDPFLAYLGGGVDSCNDQDVRRCLHRLAELAEWAQCAVVLLRHLTKLGIGKAVYRGQGSIGIIGAARAGLLVARDPDCDNRRVLACSKSNLAALPTSLRFTLESVSGSVCRVAWRGTSEYQADDLVNQAEPVEERIILNDARQFLRNVLADGPVSADECLRQARQVNISERTLRRAKASLRVESIREGDGLPRLWLWRLP